MHNKVHHKEKAINLRRKGLSYKDILKEVPVAKSTLSLWLKEMPLTDSEKHLLKQRQNSNITLGRIRAASALHDLKIERDKIIFSESLKDFALYKKDPFFHLGVALYWAEGSKRSSNFSFMNSDPEMVTVMIKWIHVFLKPDQNEMKARLYIHKPYAHENCEEFWSSITGIRLEQFGKTIYKPTNKGVKKRPKYKGCLRIELGKVHYFRTVQYWQQMLIEYYRKQR